MALAYASEDLRGDAEVLAAAAGNTQRQVEVTPSFFGHANLVAKGVTVSSVFREYMCLESFNDFDSGFI